MHDSNSLILRPTANVILSTDPRIHTSHIPVVCKAIFQVKNGLVGFSLNLKLQSSLSEAFSWNSTHKHPHTVLLAVTLPITLTAISEGF